MGPNARSRTHDNLALVGVPIEDPRRPEQERAPCAWAERERGLTLARALPLGGSGAP